MLQLESFVYLAFLMGIISAASLPLGTLTTLIWQPSDRALAWLMAFGAGALLSAVTVDLFSPAVENGLFAEVSLGAIIGSLIYLFLNKLVNEQGGFLRKTATTIQFLRRKQRAEELTFLDSLNRLTVLKELSDNEKKALLSEIKIQTFPEGTTLYHHGDIANAFYLIQKGRIGIQDPQRNLKTFIELDEQDAFGRMAFFTCHPNATLAVAKTEVTLWKIDKDTFNTLLKASDTLLKKLIEFYQPQEGVFNPEMLNYLQNRHHYSETEANAKLEQLVTHIQNSKSIFEAEPLPKDHTEALNRLQNIRRFPLLEQAPDILYPDIAHIMQPRQLRAGETLYKKGGIGDRVYLIEQGEIDLIDPADKRGELNCLSSGDFLGVRAFVVGGRKATTAIAKTDIKFWIITKEDFETLLFLHDQLQGQFQEYLKSENIETYLVREHKLSTNKAQKWVHQSVRKLVPGHMPVLNEVSANANHSKVAYIAIWLGIFLDGIPESLVIGATVSDSMISMSLIAGLFLSNYPEALSSSASMREQGIRFSVVLWAWTSLMLLTGIGAAIGSVVFMGASPSSFALISGIAAGAMLTVIAETMLPEAYFKGGSIIGLVTLLGFIAALFFKVLDPSSVH